jgi:hypothetical protein
MHTQNFLVYKSSNWHDIKNINENFPNFEVIFPFALVIKAINSVYTLAFMITSEKKEILRVFDFICKQETNTLDGLFSPINIIA